MPFTKNRKKIVETDASDKVAFVTENRVLSEEGLFDIAFDNYKKQNPESGMKRRDFRRNVWGSDDVMEYLTEEQAGQYQAYLSGIHVTTADRGKQSEAVSEKQPTAVPPEHMYSVSDSENEDSNILDGILAATGDEFGLGEYSDAYGKESENEHSGVSQVEPAFDEHFLDGFLDADEPVHKADGQDDSDGIETEDDVEQMADLQINDELQGQRKEYIENDVADRLVDYSDQMIGMDEYRPDADLKHDKDVLAVNEDQEQSKKMESEQTAHAEHGQPAKYLRVVEQDGSACEPDEVSEGCAVSEGGRCASECTKEPMITGIFAVDGIMERLRQSLYLDVADTSMDDEILQFDRKEVFEQLLRLEGCVRKVGTICDIADLVFGSATSEKELNEPSVDRLREIVISSAEAISSFMRCPCDSKDLEQWNATIAECMGLTAEERQQLLPTLMANSQYVIRVVESATGPAAARYYVVTGDYTEICRVLFWYESSYENLRVKGMEDFLVRYGVDFCEFENENDEYMADISVENGKVRLN